MKNIYRLTILLFALFYHNAKAQQPVDSVFLAQLDTLVMIAEREQAVREVVAKYEQAKLKQEQQFDYTCMMPMVRGLVLTSTERNFMQHDGMLKELSSSYGKSDYVVAGLPLAAAWTMKAAGVKSRSKMQRMATANAMSMALTFGTVNLLKETVGETRPDGSDERSMPSGHAALAFASASILAREYGYISPWITIGGFATATGTQFLRVQHNKHWMNDLYMGAGIGMLSTSLAYYLTDLMFKDEGILTLPEVRMRDLQRVLKYNYRPSGFTFVTGSEVGSRTFNVEDIPVKAYASLTAGVDASWFFNEYLALDLMARCTSGYAKLYNERTNAFSHYLYNGDNMQVYHASVGARYSVPYALGKRFNARAFAGIRHIGAMIFREQNGGEAVKFDAETNPELGIGIGYDAIDKDNYAIGFACDYYHAFSNVMSNRFSFSSAWKILF